MRVTLPMIGTANKLRRGDSRQDSKCSFFKCLPFELPEDVVNKTLQIILELQFFKLSLFDLCCHNSSKTFQQPFISAIKSYSFRLFSSLPGVLTPPLMYLRLFPHTPSLPPAPVHQGQVYRPQVVQPPAYQAPAYQAPAPQNQGVSKEDFHSYVKANDAVMRNMQTQGQNMQNQLTNLTDMLSKFVASNTASTSGTLPSNTVTNPKEDLKGITTRSGVAYKGPTIPITSSSPKVMERDTEVTKDTMHPTNNGSTEDVPPPVVPVVNHESISEPANTPVRDILHPKQFLRHEPLPPLQGNYFPETRKDLKICEANHENSSVNEPPELELKDLPPHLEYAFLEGDDKLPVIIAKDLKDRKRQALHEVLSPTSDHRLKLPDIKGINQSFVAHGNKILYGRGTTNYLRISIKTG
ncbi:hypothetical protein Tco_0894289 [Tanacetum coccineum]|uniref:Reverse transcriptase domain-containing protein n=1 Tax=Tanacetum coccineum TaxID=301880 RepID=A0ABQ5CCT9_9ASTR